MSITGEQHNNNGQAGAGASMFDGQPYSTNQHIPPWFGYTYGRRPSFPEQPSFVTPSRTYAGFPSEPLAAHNTDDCFHADHLPSPMSVSSSTATVKPAESEAAAATAGRESLLSVASSEGSGSNIGSEKTAEEIVYAVQDVCLAASQKYLEDRQINWSIRTDRSSQFPFRRNTNMNTQINSNSNSNGPPPSARRASNIYASRSRRWSPYATPAPPPSPRDHTEGHVHQARRRRSSNMITGVAADDDMASAPSPTASLLANISSVSSGVWRQSQRDRLHVPGTERAAIQNMACLLDWAETVVWGGLDEHELREGEEEGEGVRRVLAAGRNLCAWLGDEDGKLMVEGLGGK